ncbi:Clp protease ClpP [Adhaeribacter aquaticus]|uniref:Clp protease ClpP n=1 Tax=Adhaeribacter aquaticus TaxID=299567 RepID=UPI0004185AF2|nr:Clp protease ClpP [Adhaeribacter aquaticus]
MAKELHIRIDDVIGVMDDGFFMWPGFMAFMLDGMLEANPDAKDLVVHVDSPGGDIIEGYRIYNRLVDFKKEGGTVRVIVEGMAASMATAIVQAASPGMREARAASTWMMHKPLFSGIPYANANDLRKMAATLDNFEHTLTNIYVQGSGLSAEEVNAHLEEEQFINPEIAVERGYLDRVLEEAPVMPVKQRESKAIAFYNPKNIQSTNTDEMLTEEQENSIVEKIANKFKALFTPKNEDTPPAVVAASKPLKDGSSIYFDGELAEGTAVFSDAELTTPLADGSYELEDGQTITVAGGTVSSIAEAVDPNAQALAEKDQEIQNLKDQLAQASAKDTEITNLKAEITALKKTVPGGGDKTPNPPQNFKGDNGNAGGHPLDKVAKNLKIK